MSQQPQQTGSRPRRLPALLSALGVGVILITSGVAVRVRQNQDIEIAMAATMTASVTDTPTPTETATPEPSATPTVTPTPTITPTGTLRPTATPTPTDTPAPTPVPPREVGLNPASYATPEGTPVIPIPEPVGLIDIPANVVNVLLLGSDKRLDDPGFRTDVIIVVSINLKENTVNMLSLPRDLVVYIPGWRMNKINTAYQRGEAIGHPGGGFGMLQETLLYNFGIRVDHYAFVDLSGFQDIVDVLGGVEVPVDCSIAGWMLSEPRLRLEDFDTYDEWVAYTADEDNWEWYVMPVGMQTLDGYEALWYARYRQGTSDFDRSIRQHQVLRAMVAQAQKNGLTNIRRIPDLWREYSDLVQTDMGLGNMLQFAPIAANLDNVEVTSYFIADLLIGFSGGDITSGYIPNPELQDALLQRIARAMQPPAQNYIISNTASVEVRNGTGFDRLDEVAADRLAWVGIDATPTGLADSTGYVETVIYDFTGRQKTSQLLTLQRTLRVADRNVIVQPDPNRLFDYVVILGSDYRTCSRNVPEPPTSPPANSGTGGNGAADNDG